MKLKLFDTFGIVCVRNKGCMILPKALEKGSRVGIVTPSGSVAANFIEGAKSWFNNHGYEVEVATHAYEQYGRFCGTEQDRLNDFQEMFDSSVLAAILCSRGGYGAVHLFEKIDMSGFKKYPKWLIGYSDITVFHQLLLHHGLISLHAPMARHLTEDPNNAASLYLRDILQGKFPSYHITPHQLNIKGYAKGVLIGGNLSVFAGLLGSRYTNIPEGSILFIEDIGEKAYAIDRMMWNLKLANVLNKLSGVVIGQFSDCNEDTGMYHNIYTTIYQMLRPYQIPVVFNFPVGHIAQNFPLIHGAVHSLEVSDYGVFLNVVN